MSIQTLSLNGAWQLYNRGQGDAIPAQVPGCVHTDLLAQKMIPDPYYRDNELAVLWVGETDWTYRRSFEVPRNLLTAERVILRCKGLDTIAHVRLNGHELGYVDNMFREWTYDVKDVLREGKNEIEVAFTAPMRYVREKNASSRHLPAWGVGHHKLDSGGWIRKEPCNFGWDWGPELATCGIWQDIELLAWNTARLQDVQVLQDHSADRQRNAYRRVTAEASASAPLEARATLSCAGSTVATKTIRLETGKGSDTLTVSEPRLWWPNGMGEQPLYDLEVELEDGQGRGARYPSQAHRPAHARTGPQTGRVWRVVLFRGERCAVFRQGRQLDPR